MRKILRMGLANMNQHAMMRTKEDEEYQELHEVIENMNARQEKPLSTMECKQKLRGEVPKFRRK